MRLPVVVVLLLLLAPAGLLAAANPIVSPVNRLDSTSLAWKELGAAFARQPDGKARFEEHRQFGFTAKPVVLKGESYVSRSRGLSLHYTDPEERTVIFDDKGVLIRDKDGERAAPAEASSSAAMLQILRFDLTALTGDFEVYGTMNDGGWTLALVPKSKAMKQAFDSISVSGKATEVGRIQFEKGRVKIEVLLTNAPAPTAAEMQKYFR